MSKQASVGGGRISPALRVPGVGLVQVNVWRNTHGAWVIQALGLNAHQHYGYTLREARAIYARYVQTQWEGKAGTA